MCPNLLILLAVSIDGRLENEGKTVEARLVDDVPEGAKTEETQPDVLMQVAMRAKRSLGVVEMQRAQIRQSDGGVKGVERALEGRLAAKIVACGLLDPSLATTYTTEEDGGRSLQKRDTCPDIRPHEICP